MHCLRLFDCSGSCLFSRPDHEHPPPFFIRLMDAFPPSIIPPSLPVLFIGTRCLRLMPFVFSEKHANQRNVNISCGADYPSQPSPPLAFLPRHSPPHSSALSQLFHLSLANAAATTTARFLAPSRQEAPTSDPRMSRPGLSITLVHMKTRSGLVN